MNRIDAALAAVDAGLQTSSEGGSSVGSSTSCWRCQKSSEPLTPLGLCRECDDWLHADLTMPTPVDAILLPPMNPIP